MFPKPVFDTQFKETNLNNSLHLLSHFVPLTGSSGSPLMPLHTHSGWRFSIEMQRRRCEACCTTAKNVNIVVYFSSFHYGVSSVPPSVNVRVCCFCTMSCNCHSFLKTEKNIKIIGIPPKTMTMWAGVKNLGIRTWGTVWCGGQKISCCYHTFYLKLIYTCGVVHLRGSTTRSDGHWTNGFPALFWIFPKRISIQPNNISIPVVSAFLPVVKTCIEYNYKLLCILNTIRLQWNIKVS